MRISAIQSSFNCYGYQFQLEGTCEFAIEGLRQDFEFFKSAAPPARPISLELFQNEPDYGGLPELDASLYTSRNVVYQTEQVRILDFGGRGLGRWDPSQRKFRMCSGDPYLVYEAAYLFLLSQIGKELDSRGLHRLHALALSWRDKAILVLLPMGGGKSTLGVELLTQPELKILSDDSPFIDRKGRAYAFPLRLGLLPGRENTVPEEHRRLIQRMEFGPKYVVNYSYFSGRVAAKAEPGLVILGRRTLARRGRIEPASYLQTMRAMVPNMVVGLGLYQGLEYLVTRSTAELAGKAGMLLSRFRNANALVQRSRNFILHMGLDVEDNALLIMELMKRYLG